MQHQDVVVIGGGQAGLAVSYLLSRRSVGHVVLEREAIAARWRTRWDSFTLVTPNWMIRLPGAEYDGHQPDGFLARDQVTEHLERYAHSFSAPLRLGVEATEVTATGRGYRLSTSDGPIDARAVVIATGTFQRPRRAPLAALPDNVLDLHSSDYRNPESLPAGGVLVVGSAQSGTQIAEELNEAGRQVFLSVSRAPRMPRRYRGRDITRWLVAMGAIEGPTADKLEDPAERLAANPHASGKRGGHTINLHRFARDGIRLVGRLQAVTDGVVSLAPDLSENLARADKTADEIRRAVDGYIAEHALDVPPADEQNSDDYAGDDGFRQPELRELNLAAEEISTVLWSAGYSSDFSWIRPATIDDYGYPVQVRGVAEQPGLYFIGLAYMYKPASGLLYGVGEDALHVVSHLRAYLDDRG